MLYILPCTLLYLLISLTYLTWSSTHLSSGNHQFVLFIYESVSVLFCLFLFFRFYI